MGHESRLAKVEADAAQTMSDGRTLTLRTQALEDNATTGDTTRRGRDKKSLVEIKAVVNQKPYGECKTTFREWADKMKNAIAGVRP